MDVILLSHTQHPISTARIEAPAGQAEKRGQKIIGVTKMSKRREHDRRTPQEIMNSEANDFKDEVRAAGEKEGGLYIIYEIAKKVKLKHEGEIRTEHPAFSVYIHVIESNLPIPASCYAPVFKFKRADCHAFASARTDKGDVFVGFPTPEEYYTLPDFDNKINADKVVVPDEGEQKELRATIGEYYLSSAFIQIFDDPKVFADFLVKFKKELNDFLDALQTYHELHPDMMEWGGFELHGATQKSSFDLRLVKGDGTLSSFTEGNVKTH
jgi:hypothetical protein